MRETVGSSRILAIHQLSKPVKDVCRLGEVTGSKCLTQRHIFNCQICEIQSLCSFEDKFSIIDTDFFSYVYELNFESFFFEPMNI